MWILPSPVRRGGYFPSGRYAESDKFLPLVSNGRNKTESPESTIIVRNRTTAAAKWQLLTNPTATRGQIIPPILPTEVVSPTPLVLTSVGYTSGQYIQATVKVAEMNIRAPNNRVIVSNPVCWVTSGRSSIKPSENMTIMEALRPILSTIMPDKTIPGTSAE